MLVISSLFLFNLPQPANATVLINPAPAMERPVQSFQDKKIAIGPPILDEFKRFDKIRMEPIIRPGFKDVAPYIFLNGSKNHEFYKLFYVKGGYQDKYGGLLILALMIFILTQDSSAFTPVFGALQKLGPLNAPTTRPQLFPSVSSLQIVRPSKMPHQEFVALSKEERRQVSHHYDKIIAVEGRPKLRVGFWQSRFKVSDHGAVHGLPYNVRKNGGTHTEKTDENTLEMMQSIENMPNRANVIWFDQDDVTYQGGTDREFPAVYILDKDTGVIAVFNKQTGNFVTTCQLSKNEVNELYTTHNFGGGEGWFSGKVNNLPPQGITPINSFENDIMGITPVDDSQIDNSNN